MGNERKKKAIKQTSNDVSPRANIDKMYERAVEASKEGKPTAWCMVIGGRA